MSQFNDEDVQSHQVGATRREPMQKNFTSSNESMRDVSKITPNNKLIWNGRRYVLNIESMQNVRGVALKNESLWNKRCGNQ